MSTEILERPESAVAETPEQTKQDIAVKVWNLRVEGPDLSRLLALVADDLEPARDIVVDSPFMYEMAVEMAGKFLSVADSVEKERLARGKPLRDVLGELQTAYVPTIENLNSVAALLKQKIMAWNALEAARIQKEQAEEREKQRLAAVAAAAAEAEAIAKANRLVADAADARAAGSEQVADALETEATVAVDVARQQANVASRSLFTGSYVSAAPKAAGSRETWKAECTNKAEFLKHIGARIAEGDESLIGLVTIDPKAINALAKIQQENMKIPGLRAYKEGSLSIKKVAVA